MFLKKTSGVDWLIVGLGNPGDQYENTRHNVGWRALDELAETAGVPVQKLKYKALTNTWHGRRHQGASDEAHHLYEPVR